MAHSHTFFGFPETVFGWLVLVAGADLQMLCTLSVKYKSALKL